MGNWAEDYIKYSNETGGGDYKGGKGGGSGPGCGGIMLFLFIIIGSVRSLFIPVFLFLYPFQDLSPNKRY